MWSHRALVRRRRGCQVGLDAIQEPSQGTADVLEGEVALRNTPHMPGRDGRGWQLRIAKHVESGGATLRLRGPQRQERQRQRHKQHREDAPLQTTGHLRQPLQTGD